MATGDGIRKETAPEAPFQKPTGRVSFPHRMSLDLTTEQYEWLKEVAWQNRESASGLLRLIIDRLMADEAQVTRLVKPKTRRQVGTQK
jgi:hypothetical protein